MPCCRDTRNSCNDFSNIFIDKFVSIWNNQLFISSRRHIHGSKPAEPGVETMCFGCMDFHEKMGAGKKQCDTGKRH